MATGPTGFDYQESLDRAFSPLDRFAAYQGRLTDMKIGGMREDAARRQRLQDILDLRNYNNQVRDEERKFKVEDEKRHDEALFERTSKVAKLQDDLRRKLKAEERLHGAATKLGVPLFDDKANARDLAEIQRDLKPAAKALVSTLRSEEDQIKKREEEVLASIDKVSTGEVPKAISDKALQMAIDASSATINGLGNAKAIAGGKFKFEDVYNAIAGNSGMRWNGSQKALAEAAEFRKKYVDSLTALAEPNQKVKLAMLSRSLAEIQDDRRNFGKKKYETLTEYGEWLDQSDKKDLEFYGPPAPPKFDSNGLAVPTREDIKSTQGAVVKGPVPDLDAPPPVISLGNLGDSKGAMGSYLGEKLAGLGYGLKDFGAAALAGINPEANALLPSGRDMIERQSKTKRFGEMLSGLFTESDRNREAFEDRLNARLPSAQPIPDSAVAAGKASRDQRLAGMGIAPMRAAPVPVPENESLEAQSQMMSRMPVQQPSQINPQVLEHALGTSNMQVVARAKAIALQSGYQQEHIDQVINAALKQGDPEALSIVRGFIEQAKAQFNPLSAQ